MSAGTEVISTESHRERGGVVWPILLVLGGAVLLLNSLGYLDESLWSLALQLWPAVLVAIGVDILIPRRTAWGTLLAIVAVLAVLLGSYWLVQRTEAAPVGAVSVSQALNDVESASIALEPAIGQLLLDTSATPDTLIEGSADPIGGRELTSSYTVSGGRGSYRLGSESGSGFRQFFPLPQIVWNLSLSQTVPIDLNAELGVGEMRIDLRDSMVEELSISFGVGGAEVAVADGPDVSGAIDGGVGMIVVRVPEGADVHIQTDRGLSVLDAPTGYTIEGDVIRSPVRGAGAPGIDLKVDLGIGAIQIIEQ